MNVCFSYFAHDNIFLYNGLKISVIRKSTYQVSKELVIFWTTKIKIATIANLQRNVIGSWKIRKFFSKIPSICIFIKDLTLIKFHSIELSINYFREIQFLRSRINTYKFLFNFQLNIR